MEPYSVPEFKVRKFTWSYNGTYKIDKWFCSTKITCHWMWFSHQLCQNLIRVYSWGVFIRVRKHSQSNRCYECNIAVSWRSLLWWTTLCLAIFVMALTSFEVAILRNPFEENFMCTLKQRIFLFSVLRWSKSSLKPSYWILVLQRPFCLWLYSHRMFVILREQFWFLKRSVYHKKEISSSVILQHWNIYKRLECHLQVKVHIVFLNIFSMFN